LLFSQKQFKITLGLKPIIAAVSEMVMVQLIIKVIFLLAKKSLVDRVKKEFFILAIFILELMKKN
jgi:hypothetical protein